MSVVNASYGHPLVLEERASGPLAGGIQAMGFQCGQLWGATLAAGAQAYRLFGPGPRAEMAAIRAAQRLAQSFCGSYKSINCRDVTRLDWRNAKAMQFLGYFLKGGVVRCFSMSANYSKAARQEIDTLVAADAPAADGPPTADGASTVPALPVSCAALVARKLGASDQHAVMAAGLAGGIGLSGGACGALGAAIWLVGMDEARESDGKIAFDSPRVAAVIDRFVESTDACFECDEIVGRKFEDASDHAAYVRDGGCARIIEALAAPAEA